VRGENVIGWILAFSLLALPLVEVWLFVGLGVSLTATAVWCCATAGVGWYFARGEDLSLWSELEADVRNGRVPTIEGIDAMLILIGGWALIVPGFATDAAGAALLVPTLRNAATDLVRRTIRVRLG